MKIVDLEIDDEEFTSRYLETAKGNYSAIIFWNTYNKKPRDLLNNRQFLLLRDRLFGLLSACKRIDAAAYSKIAKGHPFYFIGIASYQLGDYQTSIYFFDAAVTEDLRFGVDPKTNASPATRFLMLEGESNQQAAKQETLYAQTKVQRTLDYYNLLTKDSSIRSLTIDDLRNDFIYSALTSKNNLGLRTLVTAFITYCIEWDFRNEHFEYQIRQGTAEPFFSHLFRGCVLFESLLKIQRPVGNSLIQKLNNLRSVLKIDHIQGGNFTLKDVFGEMQNYEKSISEATKITAIARNTIGHDLGWNINITKDQYRELFLIVSASCLHAIACLWKPPDP